MRHDGNTVGWAAVPAQCCASVGGGSQHWPGHGTAGTTGQWRKLQCVRGSR